MHEVTDRLLKLQDTKYRDFHARLIPTVDKETVIGVQVPKLRRLAKELIKEGLAEEFISELPHTYYEENMLHGIIVSSINDRETCKAEITRFLPYIDNWAVCDSMAPSSLLENEDELIALIKKWAVSKECYTARFAIVMLMKYFADECFSEEYLDILLSTKCDDYYVKMAVGWCLATLLAKQWDSAVRLIEENKLDSQTHNMTIRKAIESYRITAEQKSYLRTLKR